MNLLSSKFSTQLTTKSSISGDIDLSVKQYKRLLSEMKSKTKGRRKRKVDISRTPLDNVR